MMMVQYLLDADDRAVVPGVAAPQVDFGDIVAPVALAIAQEKRVSEQINALAALARAGERLLVRAVHAVVHQGADRGGRDDVGPAAGRRALQDNAMDIEDYLAREQLGEADGDPTAPHPAGAGVSTAVELRARAERGQPPRTAAPAQARRRPRRTAARAGARARATQSWSKSVASRSSDERALLRPGGPVDAVGDERVVDVADGQDACRRVELVARQPARVARAVEPLVVVEHQPQHARREAAELAQQALAGLGVLADVRELLVVERARAWSAPRTGPRACPCHAAARPARAGAVAGAAARAPRRPVRRASRRGACVLRWRASFSPRRTTSARTRAPRNDSSWATSSVAPRSPTSGRDAALRRRSSATGMPSATTPPSSSSVAEVEAELGERHGHLRDQREREPGDAGDREQVGRPVRELPGARARGPRSAPSSARPTASSAYATGSAGRGTRRDESKGTRARSRRARGSPAAMPACSGDQRLRCCAGGAVPAAR